MVVEFICFNNYFYILLDESYSKVFMGMGLLSKIILSLVIVIGIGVLVVGYFGFVPGLSELMGANKPLDLGVVYTSSDLANANSKLGVSIKPLPPTEDGYNSLSRSGEKHVTASFTSAELSALFNDHSQKWKYYPIKDIQVKIANDGTVELSGVLLVNRFGGLADALEIPEGARSQVRPYLSYISSDPSIYIKGSLSVANGVVQSNVEAVQVGKLSVPVDQIQSFQSVFKDFIQDRADGRVIHINSASFSGGRVNIDVIIPEEVGLTPP